MASSAFATVAEFPTPAISACPRPSCPAQRPSRRSNHRTNRRIYRPTDCHDCILGPACPAPQNCRQTPISVQLQTSPARTGMSRKSYASSPERVTEMALRRPPVRPSRISRGRLPRQRRPRPPPNRAGRMAQTGAVKPGEGRRYVAQPARFPARVGWHCVPGRLPRQRVRGTPSRRLLPRVLKGRVGDWSARATDWPAWPRGPPADRHRYRRGAGGMQHRPRTEFGAADFLPGAERHHGRSPASRPAGRPGLSRHRAGRPDHWHRPWP